MKIAKKRKSGELKKGRTVRAHTKLKSAEKLSTAKKRRPKRTSI